MPARWLVLAAATALVASCGSAPPLRPEADSMPARGLPTASARDQAAVTRFIAGLRRDHRDFHPDADWRADRLILAVPDPTSPPWPRVEGRFVGGLRVDVLHATVSTQDYEHAISAIGRATFTDRDLVSSFDYPPDGSHVIVRIRHLHRLDDARRAGLRADLEEIASVPFELVRAPRLVRLPLITTIR